MSKEFYSGSVRANTFSRGFGKSLGVQITDTGGNFVQMSIDEARDLAHAIIRRELLYATELHSHQRQPCPHAKINGHHCAVCGRRID